MKTKSYKLLLPFALSMAFSFQACKKCTHVDCFDPPVEMVLSFVDSISKNDWFIENGVAPDSLKIFSLGEMRYHPIEFSMGDSLFRFSDREIGWENGGLKTEYRIEIDTISIPFIYDSRIEKRECCAFFEINEVDFGKHLESSNTSENFFLLKL